MSGLKLCLFLGGKTVQEGSKRRVNAARLARILERRVEANRALSFRVGFDTALQTVGKQGLVSTFRPKTYAPPADSLGERSKPTLKERSCSQAPFASA